jgi:hypothetical protein
MYLKFLIYIVLSLVCLVAALITSYKLAWVGMVVSIVVAAWYSFHIEAKQNPELNPPKLPDLQK